MLFEGNVVVDVHPGLLPTRKLIGSFGEGFESRLVQRDEESSAGLSQMLHWPFVQVAQQFANRLVQLGQAEKGPVAQAGQDPTLDHLHTHFHLGLVFGLARRVGTTAMP